ncbi:MAG: hypothetical protein WCY11_06935, partial [Novosphingobium sp.]
MPSFAQEAGEAYIRVAAARTKLLDEGRVYINDTLDPHAAYKTREMLHSVVTAGYFPIDHFSLEASLSTPSTTNNLPS